MEIIYTEKAVVRVPRWHNFRSHGSHLFLVAVLFVGIIFLVLTIGARTAFAAGETDQLYVTGIIKSVNPATGLVMVDVTSSSCHGMRTFKADNLDKLQAYIQQRISFFIDSNRCNVKETYTIVTARGLRK